MTTLGNVTSEESNKDAGLFQMPMPGSNSSSAFLLDIFGASRTITINGVYAESAANIQTFIGQLDALVNGSQSATKTFASDKSGASYEVYVMSVTWRSEEGAPLKIEYTIQMMEGT